MFPNDATHIKALADVLDTVQGGAALSGVYNDNTAAAQNLIAMTNLRLSQALPKLKKCPCGCNTVHSDGVRGLVCVACATPLEMKPSQYLTMHAAAQLAKQFIKGPWQLSTDAVPASRMEPFREAIDQGKFTLPEMLWAYLQSGQDTPAVLSIIRAWAAANMPALLEHLKD